MRRKYGNKKVSIDGFNFDSKKERNVYLNLKMLERAGEIKNLELQPKYDFFKNGLKICSYFPDFRYEEKGEIVVVDVKSVATQKNAVYRLKKRLMKAFYNIDILEM